MESQELVFSDGLFLSVDNTGRKRGVLTMRMVSYSYTKYRVRIRRLENLMHLILTMIVSSSALSWCFHGSSLVPITKWFIIDLSHKTRILWDTYT